MTRETLKQLFKHQPQEDKPGAPWWPEYLTLEAGPPIAAGYWQWWNSSHGDMVISDNDAAETILVGEIVQWMNSRTETVSIRCAYDRATERFITPLEQLLDAVEAEDAE